MKISERTISALAKTITGDNGISFYRSGPQLVDFIFETFEYQKDKGFIEIN